MATGDKLDASIGIKELFLAENAGGEVLSLLAVNHGARSTFAMKGSAGAGMMADAGARPHVVHGPYHRFTRSENLADDFKRKHALVDPMQMDEVGLFELWQAGDVVTCIGNIYTKEPFASEVAVNPDNDTFPHEFPYLFPATAKGYGRDAVSLLIAHQHFGLDAMAFQRFGQSACCDGSPSGTFGGVDNQYSHSYLICSVDTGCKGNQNPVR